MICFNSVPTTTQSQQPATATTTASPSSPLLTIHRSRQQSSSSTTLASSPIMIARYTAARQQAHAAMEVKVTKVKRKEHDQEEIQQFGATYDEISPLIDIEDNNQHAEDHDDDEKISERKTIDPTVTADTVPASGELEAANNRGSMAEASSSSSSSSSASLIVSTSFLSSLISSSISSSSSTSSSSSLSSSLSSSSSSSSMRQRDDFQSPSSSSSTSSENRSVYRLYADVLHCIYDCLDITDLLIVDGVCHKWAYELTTFKHSQAKVKLQSIKLVPDHFRRHISSVEGERYDVNADTPIHLKVKHLKLLCQFSRLTTLDCSIKIDAFSKFKCVFPSTLTSIKLCVWSDDVIRPGASTLDRIVNVFKRIRSLRSLVLEYEVYPESEVARKKRTIFGLKQPVCHHASYFHRRFAGLRRWYACFGATIVRPIEREIFWVPWMFEAIPSLTMLNGLLRSEISPEQISAIKRNRHDYYGGKELNLDIVHDYGSSSDDEGEQPTMLGYYPRLSALVPSTKRIEPNPANTVTTCLTCEQEYHFGMNPICSAKPSSSSWDWICSYLGAYEVWKFGLDEPRTTTCASCGVAFDHSRRVAHQCQPVENPSSLSSSSSPSSSSSSSSTPISSANHHFITLNELTNTFNAARSQHSILTVLDVTGFDEDVIDKFEQYIRPEGWTMTRQSSKGRTTIKMISHEENMVVGIHRAEAESNKQAYIFVVPKQPPREAGAASTSSPSSSDTVVHQTSSVASSASSASLSSSSSSSSMTAAPSSSSIPTDDFDYPRRSNAVADSRWYEFAEKIVNGTLLSASAPLAPAVVPPSPLLVGIKVNSSPGETTCSMCGAAHDDGDVHCCVEHSSSSSALLAETQLETYHPSQIGDQNAKGWPWTEVDLISAAGSSSRASSNDVESPSSSQSSNESDDHAESTNDHDATQTSTAVAGDGVNVVDHPTPSTASNLTIALNRRRSRQDFNSGVEHLDAHQLRQSKLQRTRASIEIGHGGGAVQ